MDCEHTILLLPWFLNGSLDAEERRRVSGHLTLCERCRHERVATERAGEIFSQHLPAETLVDHGFGRAAPGLDRATIEEHLAICPRCSTELELVRETAWRARGEGAEILRFMPRHAPERPSPGWRWAALAAGLTLIVGGLSSWHEVEQLNKKLAKLEALQPNPKVVPLFPVGDTWRSEGEAEIISEGEAEIIEVTDVEFLTLLLQPPGEIDFPSFELEIENPEGKRLFPIQKLVRQDEGDFTVGFPTAKLPLGKLTLRLFGRRDEERREIARYDVLLIRETVRE